MSREAIIERAIDDTQGEIWECGVFRGEGAAHIRYRLSGDNRTVRLFDTFSGQPFSGPHDTHIVGSMAGTNVELVSGAFAAQTNFVIHQGAMPATFSGLENSVISVANIDVDNHDSVKACLEFIYPRIQTGGYIIIDDYGCGSCPGARLATDQFMADKPEKLVGNAAPQIHFIKL